MPKPRNYWNDYDKCRELALLCTTRTELSKLNSSVYFWSRKNGWLDTFDWLVDSRIYNNKKVDCVYAYEFKDLNSVYVGRTLMRRQEKRDYEHRNGIYVDNNGNEHRTYDSLLLFSIENKCELPKMIILEQSLTILEGREREDYWVGVYKDNGWYIINKAKTGVNSGSLGSFDRGKWTYETCKEVAIKCNSLSEFKRVKGGAYEAARLNGWLEDYSWFVSTNELLSIAGKSKEKKWTKERCYELAVSCKTSTELQNKSNGAYKAAIKNGWIKEYSWFVSGFTLIQPSKWTEDACRSVAMTCKTKSEFKEKSQSAYEAARKNGWIESYSWFVDGYSIAVEKRRKYTYEKCYEIALQCKTLSEYKSKNPSAYCASRLNDWLKYYTWFISGRNKDRKWTYEKLKIESSKYLYEHDFMIGSPIAYRKARDNNFLKDLFGMKFNFNGYFEMSGFELKINPDISIENYSHIIFSSSEAQKTVFNFYKQEMQQGQGINTPNTGRSYIEQTGFYDLYPKRPSWEKFKNDVCPVIIYSFEVKNGIVFLNPLRISENNAIIKEYGDKVLRL